MMSQGRVAILGAGLSGLGAATGLTGHDVVIYEKSDHVGGHASSDYVEGFTFDEGPHISFTNNEKIRAMFAENVKNKFAEYPGIAFNYFHGLIIKHPVQFHMYPLPDDLKAKCLIDLVEARHKSPENITTYKDWCYRQFGCTFTETFVRDYTRKYWTVELEELDTDWVGPRIGTPNIEQVITGALTDSAQHYNYITMFRYPKNGGFSAFYNSIPDGQNINLNRNVVQIHPESKSLLFSDGSTEHYDHLISSIPLPELIKAMPSAPAPVVEAADRLRWTSHFLVNVGVKGNNPQDGYWIYYYDQAIPFSRVSFPSRFSADNAPNGHYSLQAEVVYSVHKPLDDPDTITEKVIDSLCEVGLIQNKADIVLVHTRDIEYANVIFDLERKGAVKKIHDYLKTVGIGFCGRYGEWAYLWSDQSFLSGEHSAKELIQRFKVS